MVWGRVWLLAGVAGLVGLALGGVMSAGLGLSWWVLALPLGLAGAGLVGVTAREGFGEGVAARLPRPLRGPTARLFGVRPGPSAR